MRLGYIKDFNMALKAIFREAAGRLKALKALFTTHPAQSGEGYFQHLFTTIDSSVRMIAGGLAGILHALFPWLLSMTANETVQQLHVELRAGAARRVRAPQTEAERAAMRREPRLFGSAGHAAASAAE